jgi:hypothetical protein
MIYTVITVIRVICITEPAKCCLSGSEAEYRVREDERRIRNVGFAEKAIMKGFDNALITELTDLAFEQIEEIRKILFNS